MSIFKGQKFCMGRFIDFANQVMEQLVSSLSDKSIDFIQKLENSEAIRTQDGYTFPGKLQFILDWLLGSLLKIGKFDDSNLESKKRIFFADQTWKLLLNLIKDGSPKQNRLLFKFDQPEEILKLSQPILIIFQIWLKLVKRFSHESEAISSVKASFEELIDILNDVYFPQLGTNPSHYTTLLEDVMALSSEFSSRVCAKTINMTMKFVNSQEKKSSQLVFEKILPQLVLFTSHFPAESHEAIYEKLTEYFITKELPQEFEKIVCSLVPTEPCSLADLNARIQNWKPENSAFYMQMAAYIFKTSDIMPFKTILFRLFKNGYNPLDSRKFLFNFFALLVSSDSGIAPALFPLLIESGIYLHRNDHTYELQTKLLKDILMINSADIAVLKSILNLNYYIVQEAFESLPLESVKNEIFLNSYLTSSIEARQLPKVLQDLIKKPLDLVQMSGNAFQKVSKPVMTEICKMLLEAESQYTANVYSFASSLSQNSPFASLLTPLLQVCFDSKRYDIASAEHFVVNMLNKLPDLTEKFSNVHTGIHLIDILLNPESIAECPADVLVRVLPLIKDDQHCKVAIDFILQKTCVENDPEYWDIFRIATFYETKAITSLLVSRLLLGWDTFEENLICKLVSMLPRELFKADKSSSLVILEKLSHLNQTGLGKAISAIIRASEIDMTADVFARLLGKLSHDDLSLALSSCLRHHGYDAVLQVLEAAVTKSFLYVGTLYYPSNIERFAADPLKLESFTLSILDGLFEAVKASDQDACVLIDNIANCSIKIGMDQVMDKIRKFIEEMLHDSASTRWLPIAIKVSPPSSSLRPFLARILSTDARAEEHEYREKSMQLIYERQDLAEFKETMKIFVSIRDDSIIPYLIRGLNLEDKIKARLVFETACSLIKGGCSDDEMEGSAMLAHRLVLAKSIRPLTACEVGLILTICRTRLAVEIKAAIQTLSALQASYWHILRQMLPAYIGLLIVCMQHVTDSQSLDHCQLFARLITDMSGICVPGSGGLAYALPPLILQYVRIVIGPARKAADHIKLSIFNLFKHLDLKQPTLGKDDKQPAGIDHMGRMVRICQNHVDERTVLMRLVEEYRKGHKYTGKA